jgi:hypothetical protein
MKLKFTGLMGVGNDGTLYTPSGNKLIRLPLYLAFRVQAIQHWYAQRTWA